MVSIFQHNPEDRVVRGSLINVLKMWIVPLDHGLFGRDVPAAVLSKFSDLCHLIAEHNAVQSEGIFLTIFYALDYTIISVH